MDAFNNLNINDALPGEDDILQSLSINDYDNIPHHDYMDIDQSFEFDDENTDVHMFDREHTSTPFMMRPVSEPLKSTTHTPTNFTRAGASRQTDLRFRPSDASQGGPYNADRTLQESHSKGGYDDYDTSENENDVSEEDDDGDDYELSDNGVVDDGMNHGENDENKEEEGEDGTPNVSNLSMVLFQVMKPTKLGARLATGSLSNSPVLQKGSPTRDESSLNMSNLSYGNGFQKHRSTPNLKNRIKPSERNVTSFSKASKKLIFKNDQQSKSSSSNSLSVSSSAEEQGMINNDSEEDVNFGNSYYDDSLQYTQYYTPAQSSMANAPWGRTPVQLQMHHHHYYPSSPLNHKNSREILNQNMELDNLPAPWQQNSDPIDRRPYVISSYLQLFLNFGATCYALSLLYKMVGTIKSDIRSKMEQEINSLIVEIGSCKRSFDENGCAPETIVPALEEQCSHWEKCMNRDPYFLANKSSISAETLGMIINSLVEPIGIKSFLIIGSFFLMLFICNFSFGFLRAKSYYGWNSYNQRQQHTQPSQQYNQSQQRIQFYNSLPINENNSIVSAYNGQE